jgi:hypothetical protein
MDIKKLELPPVTPRFYATLQNVFPTIEIHTITKDTTLEELHRIAGQQEVLKFIEKFVKAGESVQPVQTVHAPWYKKLGRKTNVKSSN